MADKSDVTIKIPRQLYEKLQVVIGGTGFHSVTEFIVYVLRDLISTEAASSVKPQQVNPPPPTPSEAELTVEEIRLIRKRLQDLGYL
jgi:Arc/MetJ-type ribon-helix-helix transcriptional regulator